jgi:hypothetical protein
MPIKTASSIGSERWDDIAAQLQSHRRSFDAPKCRHRIKQHRHKYFKEEPQSGSTQQSVANVASRRLVGIGGCVRRHSANEMWLSTKVVGQMVEERFVRAIFRHRSMAQRGLVATRLEK